MYNPVVDMIASICFVFIGIYLRVEASKIRVLSFGMLGGDFFPKVMSAALIVLSCIWFIVSIRHYLKVRDISVLSFKVNVPKIMSIVIYLLIVSILIYFFRYIGFILFSILSCLITYISLKKDITKKEIFKGVIYSVIVTISVWYIFVQLLGLVLPKGVLFS